MLPSVYVPTALNPWLVNCAIVRFAGRIVIEDRIADWTLTVVLALIEPELAEIVSEPRARAVANPPPPIDAKLLFDEDQVTELVMSCVL